ncbi:MAG TPA: hypothetical protein VGI39_27280, partial [Polyangiaceae bacterium]
MQPLGDPFVVWTPAELELWQKNDGEVWDWRLRIDGLLDEQAEDCLRAAEADNADVLPLDQTIEGPASPAERTLAPTFERAVANGQSWVERLEGPDDIVIRTPWGQSTAVDPELARAVDAALAA